MNWWEGVFRRLGAAVDRAFGAAAPPAAPAAWPVRDDPDAAPPDAVVPGWVRWEGGTDCDICGWEGRSVVPIPEGQSEPVVAMECPGCGNMTLRPF